MIDKLGLDGLGGASVRVKADPYAELKKAAEEALGEELHGYRGDGNDTDFMSLFQMRCPPSKALALLAILEERDDMIQAQAAEIKKLLKVVGK